MSKDKHSADASKPFSNDGQSGMESDTQVARLHKDVANAQEARGSFRNLTRLHASEKLSHAVTSCTSQCGQQPTLQLHAGPLQDAPLLLCPKLVPVLTRRWGIPV